MNKYTNKRLQYLIFLLTEACVRSPWPAGLAQRTGARWERDRGPHLRGVDDGGSSGELGQHMAQVR
jgi:hypothetical protein